MSTYLDRILLAHRETASADRRRLESLMDEARSMEPCRGFARALRTDDSLSVIAEIKRRSPSKGDLFADLDPSQLAKTYESAGAACLSVLTDSEHFGGSGDDLTSARKSVSIPVLRKDFTVDPRDVCDARLMGADCVLLIVAALDRVELRDYCALGLELGLDVLIEVHDEAELETALANAESALIGVNQRDLVTFQVDTARAVRVAAAMPDDAIRVAESGVSGAEAASRLAEAGFDAILVGEHLVTSPDPAVALRQLRVQRSG